jgi:hypothetical protein
MINEKNTASNKRIISGLPQKYENELPYLVPIRRSWTSNQSHCEKKYNSNRETFTGNKVGFCKEWMGEVGFLRYYLFHIDHGYISGTHMLERADKEKGFSPDNCRVVLDPKRRNKSNEENANVNQPILNIDKLSVEQKMMFLKELLNDTDISNLIDKKN